MARWVVLCLVLSAASLAAERRVDLKDVLIRGVPHVRQKPDFCGEACAEMWLRKLGKDLDQDFVFDQSGLDPLLGRGCHAPELVRALGMTGFKPGKVWHSVDAAQAEAQVAALWRELHADLVRNVPSIVCMRYGAKGPEHFRLVLGYDASADEVIYHEPAVDRGAYRRMGRADFLRLWPLKYGDHRWTVIRMRLLVPNAIRGRTANTFTRADYAQHVMKIKPKVPRGFTMVVQPPFVVVGDCTPHMVRVYSKDTVKWAVS